MNAPLKKKSPRLLTLTKPNATDWKPFIDSHEKLNDPFSREADASLEGELSTRTPLNKELLRLAEEYRLQLPSLMEANIGEVRTFFLTEIAPLLLATSNGLQDAKEVLAAALEEEPAVSSYFSRIEKAVDVAVEVKILNFVTKISRLGPQLRNQFLLMTLSKENHGVNTQELMSQVLSLSHMQKSREGAEVQLRGVQKPKGRRVNPRA